MEFTATTFLMLAILALVSIQTFQLLTLVSAVSSLSIGGGVAAAQSVGATNLGVGTC